MQQVRRFVTDFVANHSIAAEEQSRILIVLEELITNLEKYGYPNRSGRQRRDRAATSTAHG